MGSRTTLELTGGRSGLAVVTTRAAVDAEFRRRLLADARAAIRDVFSLELPESFRLRFIEKGADVDMLVVLPDLVYGGGALPDEQLDSALGGTCGDLGAAPCPRLD